MNCVESFLQIRKEIPSNVKIVAVSKNKPFSTIEELYLKTGHVLFGENKAQELLSKVKELPPEIEWHFIGHLQTNKVKMIAPFVCLIQSVDSFDLLKEINKEALKCNRVIPVLIQFYISSDENKFGFSMGEAVQMFNDEDFYKLKNIIVKGVMGIATFTSDTNLIRNEFKKLNQYFTELKNRFFSRQEEFCEISMGMTNDYQIAIAEGSTMVRIGSGIFGKTEW